jgi:hypothetical protein
MKKTNTVFEETGTFPKPIKTCPHCKRVFTKTEAKTPIFCCQACEEGY